MTIEVGCRRADPSFWKCTQELTCSLLIYIKMSASPFTSFVLCHLALSLQANLYNVPTLPNVFIVTFRRLCQTEYWLTMRNKEARLTRNPDELVELAIQNGLSLDPSHLNPHPVRRNLAPRSKKQYDRELVLWYA